MTPPGCEFHDVRTWQSLSSPSRAVQLEDSAHCERRRFIAGNDNFSVISSYCQNRPVLYDNVTCSSAVRRGVRSAMDPWNSRKRVQMT